MFCLDQDTAKFIDSTFFCILLGHGRSELSIMCGGCFHLCHSFLGLMVSLVTQRFESESGYFPFHRLLVVVVVVVVVVVAHLVYIMTKMLPQRILVEKTGQYILGSFLQHIFYTCSNGVCGYFQTKKSLTVSLYFDEE